MTRAPAPPRPPFTLHLLGTPRITGPDGAPVDLPLGKPLAALCFVALEPAAVSRTDLARILWPGSADPRARASIRQVLWLIRKHTDAGVIVEDGGELRIDSTVLALDLDTFERHLAAARFDDALALWDGGPLRGFALADAPAWLAWADAVRSRLEARLGHALEAKAVDEDPETKAVLLRQAVEVRPYRVVTWLALVQALVDLRDAEGADAALARLRQVADPEDEELVLEAEERIRLLHRSAFGDPHGRLVPEFVGRAREFSALMEAWRSALSGRPRVMGLLGPPGIGKTALAHETVKHVEVDGGAAVEARAVRTEARLDFGVVGSLVADLLRRPGAAGTSPASAQILRSLVPSDGAVAGSVPRATPLADALADLVDAVADEAPLLLMVDDVQWMDEPSALVLLRMVRQLHRSRVLMLWTARRDADAAAPALTALDDATARGGAGIVELGPLSGPEIGEMVTLLLSERDEDALGNLAASLHQASGGSPLHVVEMLQEMRDRGVLGLDAEGRWTLAEDVALDGPVAGDTLAGTLEARIEALSGEAQRLGRVLARRGVPLRPDALSAPGDGTAAPRDPGRARAALAELLDRDLARWTRDDRLQLSHQEVAEAFLRLPSEDGDRPRRAPWPPLRIGLAGGALVAALAALFALVRPSSEPAPPFGGGTIWVASGGVWYGLAVPEDPGDWRVTDTVPILPGFNPQALPPQLQTDGRGPILMGLATGDPGAAPDAALLVDGRIDTLFSSPGDDLAKSLDPAGRAALINVQHPDTAFFRHMTVRVSLDDPTDTTVLAAGPVTYAAGDWSPDGRWIIVSVDAPWDTVVVADPGGRRLGALPTPARHSPATLFCGPPRVIITSFPPASLPTHTIWDPVAGTTEEVTPAFRPAGRIACSPDGSALAYLTLDEQRVFLVIEPVDGGAPQRLEVTHLGPLHVLWSSPPQPAPAGVRIDPLPGPLRRGDRHRASARVSDPRGTSVDRVVTWTTDDPTVASVEGAGLVTANGPGTTLLRATVDGWISDSVSVQVTQDEAPDAIVLTDDFATLDTTRWILFGDPRPRSVTVDGRPAVNIDGDGRYSDGLGSWRSFDLRGGATLEVVFRMAPFTRTDRNRMGLCLYDSELPADPTDVGTWGHRQTACVRWPADEGIDFDPGTLALSTNAVAIGDVPIGTLLPTGRWNRLSLQLRADGTVSTAIGDSLVATHPVPVVNDSTVTWRVVVFGSAVDGELLLRDLTLWRGERVSN